MADQTMGDGVDPSQFQGQAPYYVSEQYQETQEITITQTFDESQSEQQPNDQSSGTHYMHDAGRILQAAYKRYNATQQNGAAQGSQGSQTTSLLQQTPHPGRPPNSPPVGHAPTSSTGIYPGAQTSSASVPFHGASFTHSTASGYTSPIQQHGQSTHLMAQHHSSVNPASQQGTHPLSHHHASPQSSHPQSSHTQSPYMNHVTYPSFGTATHTMSSQAAQYAVNNGASPHGTATHHYSPQSQADGRYSAHPSQYLAQGHPQQSPTAQQPPSAGAGLNKTMIAKQFVKGALMAGGVLAKYNRLTGGNGN
ncbi:hypothetical protein DEU56DRAFT_783292 [Suillus clintonianus]|uniref:uncharacterized protein n=1 Tax=Suillus clintonianus TaxID=1904413 RepID=UPI001B862E93|nr:uncharacterized protein DEU56DRAFT_783292 [Suillus clintonianus]KAG2147942.1 hypothetical protein DEU56DRAFT_783292 [Suillus clintonianus]